MVGTLNLGGERAATVGELLVFHSDSEQERPKATRKKLAPKRTNKARTKFYQPYKTGRKPRTRSRDQKAQPTKSYNCETEQVKRKVNPAVKKKGSTQHQTKRRKTVPTKPKTSART